jgi:hypothetical protein
MFKPDVPERFLLGGPYFQNFIADCLSRLLDILHLLANSRPCGLVSALGLAEVCFDFCYQHLQIFVLLHCWSSSEAVNNPYFLVQNKRNLTLQKRLVKEKTAFFSKKSSPILEVIIA